MSLRSTPKRTTHSIVAQRTQPADEHCGAGRFAVGRDSANCLTPAGPVEARLVTIDSLIGDRHTTGMKVDVEGFETDVLRGCARALAEHRIGPREMASGNAARR